MVGDVFIFRRRDTDAISVCFPFDHRLIEMSRCTAIARTAKMRRRARLWCEITGAWIEHGNEIVGQLECRESPVYLRG